MNGEQKSAKLCNGSSHQNSRGERRLAIDFQSLGTRGEYPQTFGKLDTLIPDGVCGTHRVYNQSWCFEIVHGKQLISDDKLNKCVCITWKITNLTTGTITSRTETPEEALIRNSRGGTICNKIFREALETRAKHLESWLDTTTDSKRLAELQVLITILRPNRFAEGPLVFGLYHAIVQDNMVEQARNTR